MTNVLDLKVNCHRNSSSRKAKQLLSKAKQIIQLLKVQVEKSVNAESS
ncbi:hypothetical protein ACE1AT_27940 [Pelatocladus sp. BLCC-F211]